MDNQYYAGKGCECFARYQGDCCCEDADWTPKEVYILRKRVAELEEELLNINNVTYRIMQYMDKTKAANDE